MKSLAFTAGVLVLAAALVGSASAAPKKMEPGLWSISVEMRMVNHPRLQAESSFKRCITAADSAKGKVTPELETRPGMSCTLGSFSRKGDTASYTRVCTGPQGKTVSRGKMTFTSPTAYDAEVHTTGLIRGRHIDTTRKVHAERVGGCAD